MEAESTCGNDGKCDGAGACRKWGTTVKCREASCPPAGATQTKAANCDGMGTCPPGEAQSCGNYKCDTNDMCRTMCSSDAECNGKACDTSNGSCGKGLLGAQCSTNEECASDHCVDKTCCSTASCATCQSCGNSAGTCKDVLDGMSDPDSCSDVIDPCGTTGKCNGAGTCKLGAVLSTTLMVWLAVLLLPQASLAVQVRVMLYEPAQAPSVFTSAKVRVKVLPHSSLAVATAKTGVAG